MTDIPDKAVEAAKAAANEVLRGVMPIDVTGEHLEIPASVASAIFRAALSAALPHLGAAGVAVPGWQPMETAPKDGMRVLLAWKPIGGLSEHVELGKWKAGTGWCNTYGKPFSGEPDAWAPLAPFSALVPSPIPQEASEPVARLIAYIDAIDALPGASANFPDDRFVAHGDKVGGFTFGDLRRLRASPPSHDAELLAAREEIARLKRKLADACYMAEAFRNMLGEKGRAVATGWADRGVTRVHFDWGPDAAKLTGEERAQAILDMEASIDRTPAFGTEGPPRTTKPSVDIPAPVPQEAPAEPVAWPSGFFVIGGDARLRDCATEGCGQHVSIRIERDGVGSEHCEPCAREIAATIAAPPARQDALREALERLVLEYKEPSSHGRPSRYAWDQAAAALAAVPATEAREGE